MFGNKKPRKRLGDLSLDATEGLGLLLAGLEATVAELGGSIDELELDLLEGSAAGLGEEGLTKGNRTLLGTGDSTLDHEEIFLDDTVVREATHGGDVLLGNIEVGGGGVGSSVLLADLVDLLVHLSTMEETLLTGTGNSPLHAGRMPSTNASNLTKTTMGLTGKAGNTPTLDDTLDTVTLGDGNGINLLIGLENGVNGNLLLKKLVTEINLVRDATTVDLDLDQLGLLLAPVKLANLGVGENTNDRAVLLELSKLGLNLLAIVLLSVVLEGGLLRLVPVLVELALEVIRKMLGPNRVEGTETTGGLDVANDTDNNHSGALDDGNGLAGLLLVELGSGLLDITDDVSHTSLVTNEGSEVGRLGRVIPGERLHLTTTTTAALSRAETQRTTPGVF